jgi:hypothetical protein
MARRSNSALREDTQFWWADTLARDPDELGEDEQPAAADVEGLRRFLEGEVCRGSKTAGRNWPTGR